VSLEITEEFEGQRSKVLSDEKASRTRVPLSGSRGGGVILFVAEDGQPDGRREELDDDGGRGRRLRGGARGGRGLVIRPGFSTINFIDALGHCRDGVDLLLVFGSSKDRRENSLIHFLGEELGKVSIGGRSLLLGDGEARQLDRSVSGLLVTGIQSGFDGGQLRLEVDNVSTHTGLDRVELITKGGYGGLSRICTSLELGNLLLIDDHEGGHLTHFGHEKVELLIGRGRGRRHGGCRGRSHNKSTSPQKKKKEGRQLK